MILFNDTVALGDTLLTFPTMVELIKSSKEPVKVYWTNKAVGELFPKKYGHQVLPALLPAEIGSEEVITLSFHRMVHEGLRNPAPCAYPSSVFLAHHGFAEAAKSIAVPEIEFEDDPSVPTYDFVISPFVLQDPQRMWNPQKWQLLIDELHRVYPGCSIVVIGTSIIQPPQDLAKINPYSISHMIDPAHIQKNFTQYFTGVDYFFDHPLKQVVNLLSKAKKAVITVDSGPSRLMQCLPGSTHIILAHNTVGAEWCSYPGAHLIHTDMSTLEIPTVLETITSALAESEVNA